MSLSSFSILVFSVCRNPLGFVKGYKEVRVCRSCLAICFQTGPKQFAALVSICVAVTENVCPLWKDGKTRRTQACRSFKHNPRARQATLNNNRTAWGLFTWDHPALLPTAAGQTRRQAACRAEPRRRPSAGPAAGREPPPRPPRLGARPPLPLRQAAPGS